METIIVYSIVLMGLDLRADPESLLQEGLDLRLKFIVVIITAHHFFFALAVRIDVVTLLSRAADVGNMSINDMSMGASQNGCTAGNRGSLEEWFGLV